MARSIQAITGIVGVLIISAIIGLGFIAGVADSVQAETNRQVEIENKTMMMKLILYDSMIAYGCEVGGHISDDGFNSRYWGTHKDLMNYARDNDNTISFSSLNASMPRSFKGLPCTGVGFTLPETGGPLQDSTPVSKEWRDDQEGKPSRIKFKIEKDITLPKCFVHYTADLQGVDVGSGPTGQYTNRGQGEVTNSWFLMSNNEQHSVFKPGPKSIGSVNCETMNPDAPNSIRNPSSDVEDGPAMNVEVLDTTVGENLETSSSGSVSASGPFLESIDISGFKFEKGTTGFVQTNTGCKSQNPAHSISDTPGMSGREFKSDTCDNKLHPFIAITSTP